MDLPPYCRYSNQPVIRVKISFAKVMTTPPARVRKPLAALAGVVGLEGQADLHDTEAQQDHADGADQTEDEFD